MNGSSAPCARTGRLADPRIFQILFLGVLLTAGALFRDFAIQPLQFGLALLAATATQALLNRAAGVADAGVRSAVITGFGLSILLRADSLWVHPVAAAFAIAQKFVFRFRGKHLLNPANSGVLLALVALPGTWVSAGQWGQDVAMAGWVVVFGTLVVTRARRLDVSWSFLAFWLGAVGLRTWGYGYEWAVWQHQLQSGALLLFAFFMISDPMTIPNHPRGRVAHAALVAAVAWVWQYALYETNGLLWALFLCSPAVPLWDLVWKAPKFEWSPIRREPLAPASEHRWTTNGSPARTNAAPDAGFGGIGGAPLAPASEHRTGPRNRKEVFVMKPILTLAASLTAASLCLSPAEAGAFCGFYVGKADASLYNEASQVVLARDGNRTVISMQNDYQGDLAEFALVVPVPVVLQEGQIHVGDPKLFERIDAFTAPRLVEYFDPDPCQRAFYELRSSDMARPEAAGAMKSGSGGRARSLGVTVEAEYTVGEYDIVILSAKQSNGLETWLHENGYRIPKGASAALRPYVRQKMKFFVAKVNLAEQAKTGLRMLRPLQFAFETEKFMLPVRLGMINAKGPQDLIVYALTRNGRVETTNYRTVKLPTGNEIPVFVKNEFADFYRDLFSKQAEQERMRTVFTEYFWNMGWCDPCAADPLTPEELRGLGVFWLDVPREPPARILPMPVPVPGGGPLPVMVTRLHVRYTPETLPEDLVFQETGDQQNYQARYVLRHAWNGSPSQCPEAKRYFEELRRRHEQEAQTLATLTGRDVGEIRKKMALGAPPEPRNWWEELWGSARALLERHPG